MVKLLRPRETRGEKSPASAIRESDEAESVKFLKPPNFFFAAGNVLSLSLSLSSTLLCSILSHCQHISAAYILQRNKLSHFCHWFLCCHYPEILIPFFLLLCVLLYAYSHIHLFSGGRGRWAVPRTANPLQALYHRMYRVIPSLIRECQQIYAGN